MVMLMMVLIVMLILMLTMVLVVTGHGGQRPRMAECKKFWLRQRSRKEERVRPTTWFRRGSRKVFRGTGWTFELKQKGIWRMGWTFELYVTKRYLKDMLKWYKKGIWRNMLNYELSAQRIKFEETCWSIKQAFGQRSIRFASKFEVFYPLKNLF